jgi:hypothetical protein
MIIMLNAFIVELHQEIFTIIVLNFAINGVIVKNVPRVKNVLEVEIMSLVPNVVEKLLNLLNIMEQISITQIVQVVKVILV